MKIKSIRNTKIRTKLILLGAVSILGLFILGSESVSTAWQIDQVGEEISSTWINAVIIAEELNTATSDYRIQESRHAIATTPSMMGAVEEEMEQLQKEIADKFKAYRALPTMEQDQKIIREAEVVWNEYLETSRELLEISKGNSRQEALKLMMGRSQELFDQASGMFLEAVECTKRETMDARKEADRLYRRMSHIKLLVIGADSVIVLWLILYLIKSIEKPAEALADAARRATNGNLEAELDYQSEDEIGALTEAMNLLLRRLRSIINDEKKMFREIGNENFNVRSECEQSYRGDFAPILYSFTSLQSRLKETKRQHEEEVAHLKARIHEMEKQLKEKQIEEKQIEERQADKHE